MRKVVLYGELANQFGREHFFSVRSASEAIQALCANFKDFKKYMNNAHKHGMGFKIFVGTNRVKRENDTALPSADNETIRIAPMIVGSSGVFKALIGAVLVVVGVVFTPISAGFSNYLTAIGASMVLNGVYEMLASPPSSSNGLQVEDKQSFIFSGPENVTRQGGAVPIGYGRMMVGSTVISAGIEDQDQ